MSNVQLVEPTDSPLYAQPSTIRLEICVVAWTSLAKVRSYPLLLAIAICPVYIQVSCDDSFARLASWMNSISIMSTTKIQLGTETY